MMILDSIDKKILEMLVKDARTPYSKIAYQLKVSESTIYLRVKKLMEHGILKGFHADIDRSKVGFKVLAFIMVKTLPGRYVEVLKKISEIPNVLEVYEITGEFSGLVKVIAKNQEELASIIDTIGNVEGVSDTNTVFVLRVIKEEKNVPISLI